MKDSVEFRKAVVRRLIEAINRQDWSQFENLVAPAFRRHSAAAGQPEVSNRRALREFLEKERNTFPDARESIEDMVAEHSRVAVRHRFSGTQTGPLGDYPSTGKRLVADYLAIYRIAGNRIVECWAEWDNLTALVKLGHLPVNFGD